MKAKLLSQDRYTNHEGAINLFTDVLMPMLYDDGDAYSPESMENLFTQLIDSGYADELVRVYEGVISQSLETISKAMSDDNYNAQELLDGAQAQENIFFEILENAFGPVWAKEFDSPFEDIIRQLTDEITAYEEGMNTLSGILYDNGFETWEADFEAAGYTMSSEIQMINDGLIELINNGNLQEATQVIASLLDGTAIMAAQGKPGGLSQYIQEVFDNVGVAVGKEINRFSGEAINEILKEKETLTSLLNSLDWAASGLNIFTSDDSVVFDMLIDKFPDLAVRIANGTATVDDYKAAWRSLKTE